MVPFLEMLTVKQGQMNPEIITSHQEILSDRDRAKHRIVSEKEEINSFVLNEVVEVAMG